MPEIPEAPLGDDPLAPVRPLPPLPLRDRFLAVLDGWRLAPGRAVAAGAAAAAVVAVVAIAGIAWAGSGRSRMPAAAEIRLPTAAGAASGGAAGSGSATTTTAGELVVHAAGAVTRPGVYRLPAGSRVTDLLDAAGGLAPGADADRLNLAALLQDGERLWVPRVGEASEPAVVAGDGGGGEAGGGDPSSSAPVDLNTATAQELEQLPGVGPATAQAIVDYRRQHGRFRSVDDLLDVRGIGEAKLAQLRPRVRV